MTAKRTKPDAIRKAKSPSAPHEIIVQTSEPDNKQTFRPVQLQEFAQFPYEVFTLENLKKACATHFGYHLQCAMCLCQIKGLLPHVKQIPHTKNKVQ